MAREMFLSERPELHEKMNGLGVTLDNVRLAPRAGGHGLLLTPRDAYLEVQYSTRPPNHQEAFTERDINLISIRLRKILSEHEEVIRHNVVDDRPDNLLRFILHVKPKG